MSDEKITTVRLRLITWFVPLWLIGNWFTYGYAIGLDMAAGIAAPLGDQILFAIICMAGWPLILGIMVAGG